MLTTIRYILLTALRDWLFTAVALGIFLITALSLFLGGTALVEKQELAMVYSAGACRIFVMVGLILFVSFHVRRAFENREIEMFISKPMSRMQFLFCYWLGFSVLSLLFVLLLIFSVGVLFGAHPAGMAVWALSILLESMIVTAFALAGALILKSAVSATLASFTFYTIARLMGFMLAFLDKPGALEGINHSKLTDYTMAITAVVIPRLDLFGKTEWLLYGFDGAGLWVFFLQAAIYVPLLLMMGMYDFTRKQF